MSYNCGPNNLFNMAIFHFLTKYIFKGIFLDINLWFNNIFPTWPFKKTVKTKLVDLSWLPPPLPSFAWKANGDVSPWNPHWRKRHSTIDLLVPTSLDQLFFILKILFTFVTNQASLKKEVKGTEPSHKLVFPGFTQ